MSLSSFPVFFDKCYRNPNIENSQYTKYHQSQALHVQALVLIHGILIFDIYS